MKTKTWIGIWLLLSLGVGLYFIGCGEEYQSPEWRPECVEGQPETGCPVGQICLSQRCYAPCQVDTECSRWEMCRDGVCVDSPFPQDDGGTTPDGDSDSDTDVDGDADTDVDGDADTDSDSDSDADSESDADAESDGGGDADPDAEVDADPDPDPDPDEPAADCTECADRCHGLAGRCVECVGFGQCFITGPVCDIARGTCVDFAAGQCAPCEPVHAAECGAGFECVDRREGQWEVVCLQRCDAGACPSGTVCDPTGTHCVPTGTVSCTSWFSTARARTCAGRTDCLPLGAPGVGIECSSVGTCGISCIDNSVCPPGRACGAEALCQ